LKHAGNKEKETLPLWVGPAIRKICTEFNAERAVPHVWAGVESILFSPCPRDGVREKREGKLPALVGAVFSHVVTAMENRIVSQKGMKEEKRRILDVLGSLRGDEVVQGKVGGGYGEGWRGWERYGRSRKLHRRGMA